MLRPHTICSSLLLLALLFTTALAQNESTKPDKPDAATITGSASGERVRFTAPSSVVQIRLEVYDSSGKKVFDNELRGGNVLDWLLEDGQAARLADDTYLCVITAKSLSGKLSQRIGSVRIEQNSASLEPVDPTRMNAQQAQSVGPIEENAGLTILKEDAQQTTTVVAHNGEEGQITRGKGALSFRIGDFYAGKDTEQMRLTVEGNLGIGITHPQVRLDVDGLIRASQGIIFPDGSIQYSAAMKTLGATSSRPGEAAQKGKAGQENFSPQAAGAGTAGRLAKWLDGAGNLGDSVANDTGTGLQLTAAPSASVDTNLIFLNSTNGTTGMLAGSTPNYGAANGPYFAMRGNSYTTIAGQRGIIAISAGNVSSPTGTEGSIKFVTGNDQVQMVVNPIGNVGIGTTSPIGPLEVVGNGINAIVSTTFGGGLGNIPGLVGRSARGTASSPSASLTGDYLSAFRGRGFGATAFMLATGAISIRAAENFSDTAQGTFMTFETTPIGSTSASAAERMRIDHNGKVGIGTTLPMDTLDVNGIIRVATLGVGGLGNGLCRNGSNQISDCSSSLRYKTNVQSFLGGLDIVNRLRPISFTWKQGGMPDIGLGAEEVEKVAPLFTFRNDKGEIEGVKYNQLSAVFVNAFKEQQAQIVQQQAMIAQQAGALRQQQERFKRQQLELKELKKLVCRTRLRARACK